MKKGKLLEVLRIAVMCIVLEEGGMSPTELRSFLGCKRSLIIPLDQILTKKFIEWFTKNSSS